MKACPKSLAVLVYAACLSLFAGVSALRATTIEKMSLARMSNAAQLIVRAHCVSNSTRWDSGEIWTFTSFAVEEPWKNAAGQIYGTITIRLLGGTVGAVRSHVSGVPRFRPGEDVILFLERTSRGDFSLVGWAQGTFRITRDPRTGQQIVTQDTAAFATFNPATRRFEATGIRNVPLDSFRERIEAATMNDGGAR